MKTLSQSIFTIAFSFVLTSLGRAADQYHQEFLKKNPENPHVVEHDMPKLSDLKKKFPKLWKDKYGLVKKVGL